MSEPLHVVMVKTKFEIRSFYVESNARSPAERGAACRQVHAQALGRSVFILLRAGGRPCVRVFANHPLRSSCERLLKRRWFSQEQPCESPGKPRWRCQRRENGAPTWGNPEQLGQPRPRPPGRGMPSGVCSCCSAEIFSDKMICPLNTCISDSSPSKQNKSPPTAFPGSGQDHGDFPPWGEASLCLLGRRSSRWPADRFGALLAACPRFSEHFPEAPHGDVTRAPNGETEVAVTRTGPRALTLTAALERRSPPHFAQRETDAQQDLPTRPRS